MLFSLSGKQLWEYRQLNQRYVPFPFIGVAHASFLDWILERAFSVVKATVGFLIPYEEGIGLVKQLYYLARGYARFDGMELTLNALGVMSFIPLPPTKMLLPLVRLLRPFIRQLKQTSPNFIKSIGGVIGKIADDVLNRRFDTALALAPFLIIMGEMLLDGDARAGAMVMIGSINSADDILTWAEYFSLPADGWDDDGEPPELDYSANVDSAPAWSPLNPFIGQAYATPKKLGKRVDGGVIGRVFKEVGDNMRGANPKALVDMLRTINRSIKQTDIKAMRKVIFKPAFLAGAVGIVSRAGSRNLTNLIRHGGNLRISPLALIGIIGYLESRMSPELCREGCKLISDRDIQDKIRTKYALVLGDHLAGNKDYLGGREVGAAFHLAMIAVKHLAAEAGGLEIVGIEATRRIQLFDFANSSKTSIRRMGEPKVRYIDIVLNGGEKEIWVEVKSLTGPVKANLWEPWNPNKPKKTQGNPVITGEGSSGYQQQFMLDRIAATENKFEFANGGSVPEPVAIRMEWWLQSFKRKPKTGATTYGYRAADITNVRNKLASRIQAHTLLASLGYSSNSDAASFNSKLRGSCYINTFSIKNWIMHPSTRNALLAGFAQEIIDEFFDTDLDELNLEVPDQCAVSS